MEVINVDRAHATLALTENELLILCNAINETRNAVSFWEFHSRVGADLYDAEELHRKLRRVLHAMR